MTDTISDFILLLPIIFVFHDLEEVVGFEWFFGKNPELFKRFPNFLSPYRDFSTAACALAVYEELVICIVLSLAAFYIQSNALYVLWYGVFAAMTLHFVAHIGFSVYIKKYIPSVVTSVICLPPSLYILKESFGLLTWNVPYILIALLGLVAVGVNLRFAHKIMIAFARFLKKKD